MRSIPTAVVRRMLRERRFFVSMLPMTWLAHDMRSSKPPQMILFSGSVLESSNRQLTLLWVMVGGVRVES